MMPRATKPARASHFIPGLFAARLPADLAEKEAILAANPAAFFTIPHFNGYKAYLIQLDSVDAGALKDALTDGWLAIAPRALADQHAERLSARDS